MASGRVPAREPDGRLRPAAGDALVLVLLPGGSFRMGSPADEPGTDDEERPIHEVSLDAFLIAKYELTRAQWSRLPDPDDPAPAGEVPLPERPLEPVSGATWTCAR